MANRMLLGAAVTAFLLSALMFMSQHPSFNENHMTIAVTGVVGAIGGIVGFIGGGKNND